MSEAKQKLPRPKDCPFCGCRSFQLLQDVTTGRWFVRCKICRGTGPLGDDMGKGVEAWNNRPNERPRGKVWPDDFEGGGR